MIEEVDFQTARAVEQSWRKIKSIPNYEEVAGKVVFQKVFEVEPFSASRYTFGVDHEEDVYESAKFKEHSRVLVKYLEDAINMLGPDLEPFLEILSEVGATHLQHGVSAEHFSHLKDALLYFLETSLGEEWNSELKLQWETVYGLVSFALQEGIRRKNSSG